MENFVKSYLTCCFQHLNAFTEVRNVKGTMCCYEATLLCVTLYNPFYKLLANAAL